MPLKSQMGSLSGHQHGKKPHTKFWQLHPRLPCNTSLVPNHRSNFPRFVDITSQILSYVHNLLHKIYENTLGVFPQSVSLMQGKLLESPKSSQLATVTLNFRHHSSIYLWTCYDMQTDMDYMREKYTVTCMHPWHSVKTLALVKGIQRQHPFHHRTRPVWKRSSWKLLCEAQ